MKRKLLFVSVAVVAVMVLLGGCGSDQKDTPAKIGAQGVHLVGAGATFPAPLYRKWIAAYTDEYPEISISYDAVGSGEGIKRFMAETADFGASDAAMKDEMMANVNRGVQLVPATAGSIVLAYNIPDLGGILRLRRAVYTDIFLGKIRYWNDARIKADNPGLHLPRLNIVTVVRSDSSGSTYAFTNHLSTISEEWKNNGPGTGKEIDFPGNSMFGSGNGGVATKIKNSWGAIGYVEYGYAKRAGLAMSSLENRAGNFISPSDASPTATLANTSRIMPDNLRLFIPDPEGADSYPIVTYSWLLLYRSYPDPDKLTALKDFVTWGLTRGQTYGPEFGYAPLPAEVAVRALDAVAGIGGSQ
ncbi:MAG: phosphate ABC transporter substrate-binding protein PstS [Deltaproteobacteria bacterium]|nr:phosphate ABC transporter substrate-binding protein PstS [Candidatus Anaeroferrophillacea bacterium]